MSLCHTDKHSGCSSLASMPLLENVYAVSRDYEDYWKHDDRFKYIGLYDGCTHEAIPGGSYYYYLHNMPEKFNYFLTGHGLRQVDRDRATPGDFSEFGPRPPIFGGYVDSHMGHFFVEVLARGIDFSAYTEHPFVFLLLRNRADLKVFFKYCAFFGLDEKQIAVIDTPVIIPELYVPCPQFFITQEHIKKTGDSQYAYRNTGLSSKHMPAEFFSDGFLEVHRKKGDEITLEENTVDGILYLSCVKSRINFGEYIIHKALEDHGHTVIFPEEHSWESVISLVRKHIHIVGLSGSAMHFLMFCKEKKKVTYIDRYPRLQHNIYNLEQMMGNDADYVQLRVDGAFDNRRTGNLFRYDDIVMLLERLGIRNLSGTFNNYYRQVIVPAYLEYWRRQIGNTVE